MTVTLTGYMGSGKSTVGRKLADLLGYGFVDLDRYIEDKVGKSIPGIFSADGEAAFRAIEAEALRDVVVMSRLTGRDTVLALGGGTLTTAAIRDLVYDETFCIWLKADVQQLRRRVGSGAGRPLAGKAFAERLHDREPLYAKAALTVETDGLSPEQVAMIIESELKKMTHND